MLKRIKPTQTLQSIDQIKMQVPNDVTVNFSGDPNGVCFISERGGPANSGYGGVSALRKYFSSTDFFAMLNFPNTNIYSEQYGKTINSEEYINLFCSAFEEILKYTGRKKVVLTGKCAGSIGILNIAQKYPDNVSGIVIKDLVSFFDNEQSSEIEYYWKNIKPKGFSEVDIEKRWQNLTFRMEQKNPSGTEIVSFYSDKFNTGKLNSDEFIDLFLSWNNWEAPILGDTDFLNKLDTKEKVLLCLQNSLKEEKLDDFFQRLINGGCISDLLKNNLKSNPKNFLLEDKLLRRLAQVKLQASLWNDNIGFDRKEGILPFLKNIEKNKIPLVLMGKEGSPYMEPVGQKIIKEKYDKTVLLSSKISDEEEGWVYSVVLQAISLIERGVAKEDLYSCLNFKKRIPLIDELFENLGAIDDKKIQWSNCVFKWQTENKERALRVNENSKKMYSNLRNFLETNQDPTSDAFFESLDLNEIDRSNVVRYFNENSIDALGEIENFYKWEKLGERAENEM